MRYILNPKFTLASVDELDILPEFKEEAKKELSRFVLLNSSNGNVYTVTPIIYEFLNHFIQPKSLGEIYPFYAKTKNQLDQIEFVIDKFVRQMLKRKVLVPENHQPHFAVKTNKYIAGEKIGDYKITSKLANKTSVDVYKVVDNLGNEKVIKLIHPVKIPNENKFEKAKKSLQQEFDFIRQADDIPEIVNAFEFHSAEDEAYYVMENIEGISLGKFIKNNNTLIPIKTRLELISQILKIFSNLHQRNILHGDVHASNFLVNDDQVRLIDFGHGQHSVPNEFEIIKYGGVNYYMPPERVKASIVKRFINPSTFQSEVYQLGVLIYFILHGKPPFKSLTWKNLARQIKEQAPIFPPLDLDRDISDSIISLMNKSLAKDPLDRFENADSLNKTWKEIMKLLK